MDPNVGEALELLSNLGDFQAFKDIMLVAKKDKLAKAAPVSGASGQMVNTDLGVAGIEKLFEEMASATGQGGWDVKRDKGWFKAEKKVREDGRDFRTTMADLTPEQCFSMFMDYEHPRRCEWLTHIKSIKKLEDNGPDDKVIRNELQFAGLMKVALASMPKTMDVRGITRHDFPEQPQREHSGEELWVMALQRTSFLTAPAAANDMLQASEGQCLLVVMEETSLKWIPEWMQLMLITNVSPKFMNGNITKYKKVVQLGS
eukprot:jgi/Tetstr1/423295/TSEL_013994.t1